MHRDAWFERKCWAVHQTLEGNGRAIVASPRRASSMRSGTSRTTTRAAVPVRVRASSILAPKSAACARKAVNTAGSVIE
jgi:hypothetical protein